MSVGALQTCAGHDVGSEAAIHAMRAIFEDNNTHAVLLVDATNAFNLVNHQDVLHNISILCPSCFTISKNTYGAPIRLFITGDSEFVSIEGTTQGDPLAMAMYAHAVTPLIDSLCYHQSDVCSSGETLVPKSANRRDDARVDIHAKGFGVKGWV